MIRIIIFIAVIVFAIYLINYDNRLIKKKMESFNDYGKCSGSDSKMNSKNAYVLGKVGISPWGNCPGFLDQNAKWIWSTSNAASDAPGQKSGTVSFTYKWFNTNSSSIDAKINIIVDNQAYIKVNNVYIGEQKGGWGTSGGLFNVTLKTGENNFVFNALNLGDSPNSAGLLVTVVDENNRILFSTGSGWKYKQKPSKSGNTSVCPTNYPYQAYEGKICYNKKEYAERGSGPCDSWCTNDKNFGSGCGNPDLKLCSKLSVSNNEDDCFDLNYMEKRKILIAVSFKEGDNTYNNTEGQCLGIATQDETSSTSYKPSDNNANNTIYSSVYVYTGKRGGLAPNTVYKSSSNEVEFKCSWMIIEYGGSYFIKNLDYNRYLAYGNMDKNSDAKIEGTVYTTPEKNEKGEWALTQHNLWDIKKVNCNTYTIQNKKTGKYLSSTSPGSQSNFVTNVYDDQSSLPPQLNRYGDLYCSDDCFQWFIAPLPPYRGVWHSTEKGSPGFLNGWNNSNYNTMGWSYQTTPYPMRPCAPSQLDGKQIPYPWFQAMEGNSGVCLNANTCAYVKHFLVWKRLKLTLTIGTGEWDGSSAINQLYLTNKGKAVSSNKDLTGQNFAKGTTESIEFMVGLSSSYIDGLYIKVGNDGIVIDKIVLEMYNEGSWQTILNSSQSRVWVKNGSHQYSFQAVTIS